ncbi:MAG: type II toxin-antitoxin system RelE/ParE family toxin [Candidatus Bipolaricaulaceae bacterium]
MPPKERRYRIVVHPEVLREHRDPQRYPARVQLQILRKILALFLDPRPGDSKRLAGSVYRVTAGEYRVAYEIDEEASRVTVFLVAKRGDDEVHRQLARLCPPEPHRPRGFLLPLFMVP